MGYDDRPGNSRVRGSPRGPAPRPLDHCEPQAGIDGSGARWRRGGRRPGGLHTEGLERIPAAASVRERHRPGCCRRAPSRYPLKVGPTGRYLVDRDGRPFLIVGDSPQSLIVNLSEAQADHFFANRQAAGFNSCGSIFSATIHGRPPRRHHVRRHRSVHSSPETCPPRTLLLRARGRHDPPRRQAQARGVPRSDRDRRLAQGPAKQRHGQGLRLRSLPRAALQAVSRTSSGSTATISRPGASRGTMPWCWPSPRASGPSIRTQLQTVELNYLTSTSLDDPRWRGIVGLDAAYTYAPTYAEVLKAYRRRDPPPRVHGRGELRGGALLHAAHRRCDARSTGPC